MCEYQVLYHHNEKGYIIHCMECRHIQLGFGNVAITFSREGFYQFQECMARRYAEIKPIARNHCIKNISVPTPCQGLTLLLSLEELHQLNDMLDVAETELRSLELIGLFNSN